MRKFSAGLTFRDVLEITRTLQLENIPQHMCQEDLLRRHFLEAYPGFPIKDLQVAYDVSKLTTRTNELQNALDAKIYGEKYKASSGKDLRMYPVCMGRCNERH